MALNDQRWSGIQCPQSRLWDFDLNLVSAGLLVHLQRAKFHAKKQPAGGIAAGLTGLRRVQARLAQSCTGKRMHPPWLAMSWCQLLIRAACVATCVVASAHAEDAVLQRVQRGQSKAAHATLLVGGLVRNAAQHLPRLRKKLESLADHFARVRVVFVENDSSDGTGAYLDSWAKAPTGRVTLKAIRLTLSQDKRVGVYRNRGELKAKGWGHDGVRLLARLRNMYLAELRKEVEGSTQVEGPERSFENYWILMVDADVGTEWSASFLLEAIGHEARWHALCAHSWYRSTDLYDAFALRAAGVQSLSPLNFEEGTGRSFFPHALCGLQRQWGEHCGCGMGWSHQGKTCSSCDASATARSLLPVDSCFGGLALYHENLLHKFKACRYDEGLDDCEHVALHSCMRSQKAVIVLQPDFVARASAANSTCCVETCHQAESFPMSFLPFQPQFFTSRVDRVDRVAGLLAAGMSLEEAGQLQAALEKYQEAARLPTGAALGLKRWAARAGLFGAFLLLQYKQADKAMLLLTQGTGLLANVDPWASMIAGHVHELLDDLRGAAAWFEKALQAFESWPGAPTEERQQAWNGAWMKSRLSWLPATHTSTQEALEAIRNFTAGLSEIVLSASSCGIPAAFDTRSVETTRLTYLGPALVPHVPELASVYSRVHLRSLPNLGFEGFEADPAALQADQTGSAGKSKSAQVRVGFVSGLFGDSAVGNLARGIIWPLPRSVWVALVCLGSLKRSSNSSESSGMVVQALLERADHVEEASHWAGASPGTEKELARAREAILKLRLDCLLYLEIGLDVRSFTLAHSRLAPIQMVTYGHASTTGIPTIDVFLGFRAFEPNPSWIAQRQYSEQLVLLPGLPFFLPSTVPQDPQADPSPLQWASLMGLSVAGTCNLQAHVYLVAQTLYKLVPLFDEALVGILQKDAEAVVAIRVGHPQPQIHTRIASRLSRDSRLEPSQLARVCFIPMQNASTYFWMLKHASVVLDTFPHGGHTTTLDALSAGVPLVTLKGEHLAGGFAAGFIQALFENKSIQDDLSSCCVALTTSDYVEKAVHLASSPDYYEQAAWCSMRGIVSVGACNACKALQPCQLLPFFGATCSKCAACKKVGMWIKSHVSQVFHRRDGAEGLAQMLLSLREAAKDAKSSKDAVTLFGPLWPQLVMFCHFSHPYSLAQPWALKELCPVVHSCTESGKVPPRSYAVHLGHLSDGIASAQLATSFFSSFACF